MLAEAWAAAWPQALALWSRFTRLSDPRFCVTTEDEEREHLTSSFAMIRLTDQAVVVSLRQISEQGLERFPLEILAHEIGHHVYCPGTLLDNGRMIARMRRGLPGREQHAPLLANIYGDLLINDRLQRSGQVDIAAVFKALGRNAKGKKPSRMWTFYMRLYEILWKLPSGTLASASREDRALEGDAQLGARLIRSYAGEWLSGAGRFAALCYPYFEEDDGKFIRKVLRGWLDAEGAGAGQEVPAGLTDVDGDEIGGALHPSLDPRLSDLDDDDEEPLSLPEGAGPSAAGQSRLPLEYGAILRALGLDLTDHEAAMHYYRERARPHLVRFPTRRQPESEEPLAEGLEAWDVGSPLDDVDWLESVLVSPRVVPGMTTVQRTWGTMQGAEPQREPIDLDLYIDCSGSMPNPQSVVSYLALAGAIMALSALRAGARVQATLWSGPGQFEKTAGFVSSEKEILRIVTGYICGGTAFPLNVMRDTYALKRRRKVHIMIVSDDGVDTMFNNDERGTLGEVVVREALAQAGAGGTLVLNLWQPWENYEALQKAHGMGWQIFRVTEWDELVAFAREFARRTYGDKE